MNKLTIIIKQDGTLVPIASLANGCTAAFATAVAGALTALSKGERPWAVLEDFEIVVVPAFDDLQALRDELKTAEEQWRTQQEDPHHVATAAYATTASIRGAIERVLLAKQQAAAIKS